ncbi:MAG TPA: Hsp20/alpha crystallin family protein [Micromonosporaceae bacterium]|nr:Hsp20/alpha crystallin family protein [Micromonosporaceae bacterium]
MNQPFWRSAQDRGWWDPMRELQVLRSELGRMIGAALVGGGRGGRPDVELQQTGEGWLAIARLPGVAPEEVAVELDDRELCIRARSEEEVNADLGMPGTGEQIRSFEYRLTLPAGVDAAQIDAVMDHGLLTVALPRAMNGARRNIAITVGRRQFEPGATIEGMAGEGRRPIDRAVDREMHRPDLGYEDVSGQEAY